MAVIVQDEVAAPVAINIDHVYRHRFAGAHVNFFEVKATQRVLEGERNLALMARITFRDGAQQASSGDTIRLVRHSVLTQQLRHVVLGSAPHLDSAHPSSAQCMCTARERV